MKLIRFGNRDDERPGVLDENDRRRDLSGHFADWNREFFNSDGLHRLEHVLQQRSEDLPLVADAVRWASPIARPGKVVCIGLNYSDHAAESGMPVPEEPIVFLKAANTVVGPFDDLQIPRGGEKTDWEVELGAVIGRDVRYLESRAAAAAAIAGYCISHDVSERHFQLERGGQWTKGKSCDTFNPCGPFLASVDEIQDVDNLEMTLSVNAQTRQAGSTRRMIFDPIFLVHYLSQFMTLEAGDLISTGTPPGVGLGRKPPAYLQAGDIVELSIEGLGVQRQVCVNA